MKEEMTLSEFMPLVKAREHDTSVWIVTVPFKDGSPTGDPVELTVDNCYSEFEAKERIFLYLKNRIENQKNPTFE